MDDNAKTYEHPSYAMVQFSRRQGNPKLFGSSLETHMHYVTLSIRRAQLIREHNHDRYYGSLRGDLIEVDLSAAQFAELLTTMNVGMGVPCTLSYFNGEQMPRPPDLESLTESIQTNFQEEMQALVKKLTEGIGPVREILKKKSLTNADRQAVLRYIESVARQLGDNAPFAMTMFQEASEKIVTAAKAEVDAFMTSVITQAGVQALKDMGIDAIPALPEKM